MKTLEVLEHVLKGKRIAENTRLNYLRAFNSLAEFSEEFPTIPVTIYEWLNSLNQYADTTVQQYYRSYISALHYMQENYDFPKFKVTKPKIEKKRRRYFTPEELYRIIKATLDNEENKTLVLTFIDSSCRAGELSGLPANQVGDNFILVKGKTGERRYRCNPAICESLKKIGEGKPAIFMSPNGKPASADSLSHRISNLCHKAGITGAKLGPHTFRHSAANMVAKETGSALAVKALLQHDELATGKAYMSDVEDTILQGISPLAIMNKYLGIESVEQLALKSGEGNESTITTEPYIEQVDSNIIDLLELEYREIPKGAFVRPLLQDKDLALIREAFIGYTKTRTSETSNLELKNLFKRMMRKVK